MDIGIPGFMRAACAAAFAAVLGMLPAGAANAQSTGSVYEAMLGYLADNRIDGHAFAGVSGAIAVNSASGDLNRQANLRGLAAGPHDRGRVCHCR